jgi:hypothetical protein
MRTVLPLLATLAAMAGGCASYRTYETGLDVCTDANGRVESARVVRPSGDPALDSHALEKVAPSIAYVGSPGVACRPLTVEHRVTGERDRPS